MNGLYEAALEVQSFMQCRGWRFCIIGGLALQRWGEPRVTRDVDVTLLTGFGDEERYINEQLPPLCELKGEPGIVGRLAHLRRDIEAE